MMIRYQAKTEIRSQAKIETLIYKVNERNEDTCEQRSIHVLNDYFSRSDGFENNRGDPCAFFIAET